MALTTGVGLRNRYRYRGRKTELDRMAAMLSRLGGRGYPVREEASVYGGNPIDPDPDSDFDGRWVLRVAVRNP